MNDEIRMKDFDVNEVEPEEVIRMAREAERKACLEEQERQRRLQEEKPKRDPIAELAALLDQANEEAEQEITKLRKRNMRSCCVFAVAAGAVLAGMVFGLVDPVFALPLTAVYCMRAAVMFDRWARMGGKR